MARARDAAGLMLGDGGNLRQRRGSKRKATERVRDKAPARLGKAPLGQGGAMRRLTRWRVHRRKVRRATLLHGWLSQNHLHVGVGLPPRPQPQSPLIDPVTAD